MHPNPIFIIFLYPIPHPYSIILNTIHISFSVELFKKLYLFSITNVINFYNKIIKILSLLVNIFVLSIYIFIGEITFIILLYIDLK
jgi:hypothetical protein